MKIKTKIIAVLIIGVLGLTILSGCVEQQNKNNVVLHGSGIITIPAFSASFSSNPKYAMASYYSSDELVINSNVPQYTLPLDLTSTSNIDYISSYADLTADQKNLLSSNGFVVIDYGHVNDTIEPYNDLKDGDIPIFITSDTLLHLYHVQFDEILKGIEEREFFDNILNMSKVLFDKSKEDYNTFTNDTLKEAAKRNIAFFGIGLSLLQTPTEDSDGTENVYEVDYTIPSYVQDEVSDEIELIEAHTGFSTSPLFNYDEDYSQYKPRGHYTRSEKLRRYFKAMMWYGRISFLMKGGSPACSGCDFLISEYDSKVQTIQASLISTMLPSQQVNDKTVGDLWNRMYSVTSFFVGAADDLTPYEYLNCIRDVFGSEFDTSDFADDAKLLDLKAELVRLRSPEIYGGTGNIVVVPPVTKETLDEVLEKTKGLRLMGQRFIPDSYMFQNLVTTTGDYVGDGSPFTMCVTGSGRQARCFPRGLDVMAVLGSERAYDILVAEGDTEYVGEGTSYDIQLNYLKENFSDTNVNVTEWNRNLYWGWLYTLKSLIQTYEESYPVFMQQTAWLDKELHTALASWSELRHDTILYAKQSYTIAETGIPMPPEKTKGYVEPVPGFYNRLLALTKMTREGLTDLEVLSQLETSRLQSLENILSRLIEISTSILENKQLSDEDYDYIRNFGGTLESLITGVDETGQQTTIIADVHTDSNTNMCLEEGVGYVDLILVAYVAGDDIVVGAGPVLNYYEFKQNMSNRLTDEEWKTMLETDETPDRPDWTSSFILE